ncbi:MAG TPA: Uma2 family endonuclease [Thermomicrobiales bacterium]
MVTDFRVLGPEFDIFEDDSEETLVGSSIHQGAIVALTEGSDDCAAPRDLPWFVGNQLTLVFPRQGERPPAQPAPDICVHPTLTRAPRTSLLVAVDGPPALIIEVTSPSTALKRDLNMNSGAGKPLLYEAIGVQEYLVFDPHGEYLGAQVWARRLGPQGYAPWQPTDDGRWHSQTLGISFAPQGFLLRVFDHDGALVPLHQELRDENADLRDDNAALRARLAALEAELRHRRGE